MTRPLGPQVPRLLVDWYQQHQRNLPWRATKDAYAIWISETMLQQTRVDTVIPYYHAFLAAFPTVAALAVADTDQVLKLWQGLGYYSRARNLQRAARQMVAEHGGRIPDDPEAFGRLPGVGPYTCGAVQSIAFDRPTPAVDGNVLRVMSRVLAIRDPIEQVAVKRAVSAEVERWLAFAQPSLLTQALMELGALVCVPKSPRCGECPLRGECAAEALAIAEELPIRLPKVARRQVDVLALWLEQDGAVCIERRPSQGLLADLWQLPAVERPRADPPASPADNRRLLLDKWVSVQAGLAGLTDKSGLTDRDTPHVAELKSESYDRLDFVPVATAKHVFTHIEWNIQVFRPINLRHAPPSEETHSDTIRFVPFADLNAYAWPRAYDKLLAELVGPLEALASPLDGAEALRRTSHARAQGGVVK